MTRTANALRGADLPFALAGGCAVYAHGGPASDHDVDVFVLPEDAHKARRVLVSAGMRAVDPPEDWLLKAYDGDCLVDVIFRPNQREVTHELLERAVDMRVGPTVAPVLPATDVVIDKLLVLEAHRCDFTPLLQVVRAVRESVDWPAVAAATAHSPYARAFLRLAVDLQLLDEKDAVMESSDPPQYSVARIQDALAADPRTSELGIQVTVRGGDVYLAGVVPSDEIRAVLETVLHAREPALRVYNDVRVAEISRPRSPEDL